MRRPWDIAKASLQLAAQFSFCNFCGHQVVGVYEETMLR